MSPRPSSPSSNSRWRTCTGRLRASTNEIERNETDYAAIDAKLQESDGRSPKSRTGATRPWNNSACWSSSRASASSSANTSPASWKTVSDAVRRTPLPGRPCGRGRHGRGRCESRSAGGRTRPFSAPRSRASAMSTWAPSKNTSSSRSDMPSCRRSGRIWRRRSMTCTRCSTRSTRSPRSASSRPSGHQRQAGRGVPRLSTAGSAELVLTEPDKPLETGVEYMNHRPQEADPHEPASGGEKAMPRLPSSRDLP